MLHATATLFPAISLLVAVAMRAIDSTIRKCEKVQPKLRPGTSQHTLLQRRIKALTIAAALIKRELGTDE